MVDASFYLPGWNDLPWVVVVGFLLSFLLACGLGANDCANSYGTSVGAGVLRLWQAYVLATVFEVLGAALLGYKVTDKLSKGILNLNVYNISILYDNVHSPVEYGQKCNVSNLEDFGYSASKPAALNGSINLSNATCNDYTEVEYIASALGTLGGAMLWMLAATLLRLPVSCTHATVGATVGASLVFKGAAGIKWVEIGRIALSWVTSPLISGLISTFIYAVIKFFVFSTENSVENALKLIPVLFWVTIFVNSFSILYKGSKYLYLDSLAWWIDCLISIAVATSVAFLIHLLAIRKLRKYAFESMQKGAVNQKEAAQNFKDASWMQKMNLRRNQIHDVEVNSIAIKYSKNDEDTKNIAVSRNQLGKRSIQSQNSRPDNNENNDISNEMSKGQKSEKQNAFISNHSHSGGNSNNITNASNHGMDGVKQKLKALLNPQEEPVPASFVFTPTQVLSAIFLSFTHGANDTANAVAPLVGIWTVHRTAFALTRSDDAASEGIIIFGAASMIVGLWILGHKVIETVGHDITELTPASGFSMELGTAFTVLICSKLGVPVSTTHCLVGAVICVGYFRTRKRVQWRLLLNMALAWLITLPVAGLLAGLISYLISFAFK